MFNIRALTNPVTRTLEISGGDDSATSPLRIAIQPDDISLTIYDRYAGLTNVPIEGAVGAPRHLDLSDYLGPTVELAMSDDQTNRVTGSNGDDALALVGAGNDIVLSGAGNDTIYADYGDNFINGGAGNDRIEAGRGDDRIIGGAGNDIINGGQGIDTIVVNGNFADYAISVVDGAYQIAHISGGRGNGVDLFSNVEFIQFNDRTLAVQPLISGLNVSLMSKTLSVSGNATSADAWNRISVGYEGLDFEVRDNNNPSTIIFGALADNLPRHFNFAGMVNVGVELRTIVENVSRVVGSAFSDIFHLQGTGSARVNGGLGNDYIYTGWGDDIVTGGAGNDLISTGDGDDRLTGGRGNDSLIGAEGVDTVVFSGNFADYDITTRTPGVFDVIHARGGGADGRDYLAGIEFMQFADRLVRVAPDPLSAAYDAANETLTVEGMANVVGYGRVAVTSSPTWLNVSQNGSPIDISGFVGQPRHFNFAGVANTGVQLTLTDDRTNRVTGTDFDDVLQLNGAGNDLVAAGSGHDWIDFRGALSGDKVVRAGNGDDVVWLGSGNDRITGGRGQDWINGGSGSDTAIFSGSMSEYQFVKSGPELQVIHASGRGMDGIDTLTNIEFLQFKDQTVAAGDLLVL